jgi:hypothetical protein
MRTILHIITKPDDAFALTVIENEKSKVDAKMETFDLVETSTNYDELVKRIFAADSIQVW